MPKSKGKSKNGAQKRLKVEACQLNKSFVDNADSYTNIFSKGTDVQDPNICLTSEPFTTCRVKEVLEPGFLELLREEVTDLSLHEKNNDLYKFHQSEELNSSELPQIRALRSMLMESLKPIISKMVGFELDDRLALFCGRYTRSDYLLCHDDELEGRRVAFIFYLVPSWAEEDGGTLDLFDTDDQGNPNCVKKRLVPEDNSLVFFQVSPVSFHQVSEVLADKTRYSLGGWFHGECQPRPEAGLLPAVRGQPFNQQISEELFFSLVNPVYLDPGTQAEIQQKFEESSEISLPQFIVDERFEAAATQLAGATTWTTDFTPNRRNFACLPPDEWKGPAGDLALLLSCEPFFLLLSNLTGLKLHPLAPDDDDADEGEEDKEVTPTWKGRIRKLSQGSYSLVRDDDLGQAEFALDARLCLNVSADWQPDNGGQVVYIARGEDEELVTVHPENNSLNLVYRDKESLRFLKYINCGAGDQSTSAAGPAHDLDFTYYE